MALGFSYWARLTVFHSQPNSLFKQSGSHVREVGDGTLPIIAAQYSLYALA
ncbi:MAG TPA: hypothetical protein VH724_03900 [Candidatus Angelobacter sp.]|nr:hypothetical protein [Candidatus Angelobacter sp.]